MIIDFIKFKTNRSAGRHVNQRIEIPNNNQLENLLDILKQLNHTHENKIICETSSLKTSLIDHNSRVCSWGAKIISLSDYR